MAPELPTDASGVAWDVNGDVATLRLNRERTRNAQTPAMWRAMAHFGATVAPNARVVVVRGAGRAFSSGLDVRMLGVGTDAEPGLAALSRLPADALDSTLSEFQQGFGWLRDLPGISVAVVRGPAIGAGFQLALAADLRILASDAEFVMKETSLGLVPDLGGLQPLLAAVGFERALEICVTGRSVDAGEALRIGLAHKVVAAEALDDAVDSLVRGLLTVPREAARETKLLLRAAAARSTHDQARAERLAQIRLLRGR